jgi:predicted DNA-binding WGR domain protein
MVRPEPSITTQSNKRMDNILQSRSRGPISGVSVTRDGAVAMAPSFTRLQKCDSERNLHRYYILYMQQNLFGGWPSIREWGRIGYPGQIIVELCNSLEEADRVFGAKLRQKRRRGYA